VESPRTPRGARTWSGKPGFLRSKKCAHILPAILSLGS
jgi:hypothetical protein